MPEHKLNEVVTVLEELIGDMTVPKNVKLQLQMTIEALRSEGEFSLKVNRALNALDEISDDSNVEPYTRSQIWNVVSLLETL